MIPFVWENYDKNNTYKIDEWQRIFTFEDFKDKAMKLRDELFFQKKLEEYRDNYKQVLLTEEQYFKEFSIMINKIIKRI